VWTVDLDRRQRERILVVRHERGVRDLARRACAGFAL
jgi:hypothetical protein